MFCPIFPNLKIKIMIIGIDASNIRAGGGLTHLYELLRVAHPDQSGFSQVIIWSRKDSLNKIENREWLIKAHHSYLERVLPYRIIWQQYILPKLAKEAKCNLLFVPGGTDNSGFKPLVTMSQNMLPFEWKELLRFGLSVHTLKFLLLRYTQGHSFRKANGVIFLTNYAKEAILKTIGKIKGESTIIPHGINARFFQIPINHKPNNEFSISHPCRVIYVSIIDAYKHHYQVVLAIAQIRSKGVPIELELIGPAGKALKLLKRTLNKIDPQNSFINYRGSVKYEELHDCYKNADIGIFASSCENMPITLLEGMAAGVPMACSSTGPMPEILKEAGVYFNPDCIDDIALKLNELINSPGLRYKLANEAYLIAQQYSWEKCANNTFEFLAKIANSQL